MKTLSALIVAKNEEQFVRQCIESINEFVDEIIFVDNESTDKTKEIVESMNDAKVKIFSYPATNNMGDLRQFSLDKATGDWIFQIDCDEIYTREGMIKIREAIENADKEISFRVGYYNLSWREGYVQDNFEHYPDRLYRRDVIDRYDGILPNDMTKVKKEFYEYRPFLEYDNTNDKSFENPKQPILPVKYYHLARTRGFNFEFEKWLRYNKNIHPEWSEKKAIETTKLNQWVTGRYPMRKEEIPSFISKRNIKEPKVSVIITNYNYDKYLPESVESVKKQTHKPFEIIIVDDGSPIPQNINFEGVEVIWKHNGGVADARNWGISKSRGDYFICLDADDILEPSYIEDCLKEMTGDIQITYSNYRVFGDITYECDYGEFSSKMLKEFQPIPSCCALIDRHCFELSGGYDVTAHYEDWEFYLRLDKMGFNFKRVNKTLFNYRRHEGSRIDLLDRKKEEETKKLKEKYA